MSPARSSPRSRARCPSSSGRWRVPSGAACGSAWTRPCASSWHSSATLTRGARPSARSTSASAAASSTRGGRSTLCSPPTGSAPASPGGGSPRRGAGGLGPDVLSTLAEAVFAYIDELSADSVEGYAQAQAEQEAARAAAPRPGPAPAARPARGVGRRPRGRRARGLAAAAARGRARLRRGGDLERVETRLPSGALAAAVGGLGCAIVPDPDGPDAARRAGAAADGVGAALGPAGELAGCPARGPWPVPARGPSQPDRWTPLDRSPEPRTTCRSCCSRPARRSRPASRPGGWGRSKPHPARA